MSKLEAEHMIRSIDLETRILVAHGMRKLQKGKGNPPPYKLVLVVVGIPFHSTIRWVHIYLRELLDQTPSYF